MAGVGDQPVSDRSQLELSVDEKAARSVVISNISPKITKEDVMIYFQKKKVGGGEVDAISMLEDGKAVIVFEKPEVAARVIKNPHVLGGKELVLSPYRPVQEETLEVFSYVTALVNFGMFHLSSRESQNLLEKVKNEAGIKWRKDADGYILSGTFDQVENAQKRLEEYFVRRPYLHLEEEKETYSKNAGKTQQNASQLSKQANKKAETSDICTFEVQPVFMKVLKRVYRRKLQEIEEQFCLEIVWSENAGQVKIQPEQRTQDRTIYQKGCDIFISLYQNVCLNIRREVVEIENVNDEEGIQNAIQVLEAENQVVIEKSEKQLFVFAEEYYIKSSVQALRQQLGLLPSINQNNRRGGDSNLNEKPQRDQPLLPNILQHALSNGVSISLYQGDITEEKVDAIVNATNVWLQHGEAGVAAAIVRKGGAQIIDDSWCIMSQRNNAPLQVSDAVYTRSGNLACKYVIHTVGPEWSVYGPDNSIPLLRKACVESLRLAVRLGLYSVALPAISSGSFGMPKDVCARTIFKAVEEYSSSVDAECSNLRDVRIVVIDESTIDVFREEFVKRYCSKERSQKQLTSQSPSDEEKVSVSATNFRRDPLITKNLSSVPGNQGENVGNKSSGAEIDESKHNDDGQSVARQHPRLPDENGKTTLASSVAMPAEESVKVNTQKDENPVPDKRSGKTAKSGSGKPTTGRGNFAPSFSQKGNGNPTKRVTAGRGMTPKRMKNPPGVTATSERHNLEKHLVEPENQDQDTDAAASVTSKEETSPRSVAFKNANQPEAGRNDESAGGDILREKPLDETADEEKKLFNSLLNKANADEITNPDKIKKADSPDSKTGDSSTSVESNVPADSNLNAPKTRDTEMQTSTDNTPAEGSAADGVSTAPNSPALAQDVNQVPSQTTTQAKDPDSSPTESSTTEANTDTSQFSDTSQSSVQPIRSQCAICRDTFRDPVHPSKCGHTFCKSCVDKAVADGTAILMCNQEWCACERNQPLGLMSCRTETQPLPGYENCETIAVTYNFAAGEQGWEHPRPGQPFERLYFTAYLPNNAEGQAVCELLKRAFDARLLFTIGRSPATGEENQILWNGVDHKTNRLGGPSNYGYPDSDYLDRVRTQLEDKGIVDDETVI